AAPAPSPELAAQAIPSRVRSGSGRGQGWLKGKGLNTNVVTPPCARVSLPTTLRNSFHTLPHTFSEHLGRFGMCRNESLNTSLEKSHCTGPDTFITAYEHLDFHPSYNPNGPSHCRDQPP
uniref:CI116 protein n=1 Tax=Zonotrichia albicollis TaxID=44394 RepID=A0A8D2M1Y1_ZONAL